METLIWISCGIVIIFILFRVFAARNSEGHVGASAIRDDDPLMLEAIELAKATWPAFLKMYENRKLDSVVKFRFKAANGEVENIWGNVVGLNDEAIDVEICTLPFGGLPTGTTKRVIVPEGDAIDWQIVEPDNTLLGGFTQVAVFKIMERDTGSLPTKFAAQLGRYRALPAEGEI